MRKKHIARTRADVIFDSVNYLILTLCLLGVAYPLYFIVIAFISEPAAVYAGKVVWLPIHPTMEGYKRIFSYASLLSGFRNSLLYTLVGTVINVICTISGAYALSRKDLMGHNVLMMLITFTMIFSGGMIPNYLLVRFLGLYNTMWALILPGAISSWNFIVARTFFQQTIPDELLEAAVLDGCSDARFFFSIVLPLSSSILAVMFLFYAVTHWNSYFNALIYLSSQSKYPLQLVLRNILIVNTLDDMVNDVATQAAQQQLGDLIKYGVIIISSLPLLILYPFFTEILRQRRHDRRHQRVMQRSTRSIIKGGNPMKRSVLCFLLALALLVPNLVLAANFPSEDDNVTYKVQIRMRPMNGDADQMGIFQLLEERTHVHIDFE